MTTTETMMKFNCAICVKLEGRRCTGFKVIFPVNFNPNRPNDMCDLFEEKKKDGDIQEDVERVPVSREHATS